MTCHGSEAPVHRFTLSCCEECEDEGQPCQSHLSIHGVPQIFLSICFCRGSVTHFACSKLNRKPLSLRAPGTLSKGFYWLCEPIQPLASQFKSFKGQTAHWAKSTVQFGERPRHPEDARLRVRKSGLQRPHQGRTREKQKNYPCGHLEVQATKKRRWG